MLTTATTTVGLVPLWIGGGIMWEPKAIGIIFGLLFATVLRLLFVPVMYKAFFLVSYKNYNIEANLFVPYLCHLGFKTVKNKHKQTKLNKNWRFMGIKSSYCNLMCLGRLGKQLISIPPTSAISRSLFWAVVRMTTNTWKSMENFKSRCWSSLK